MDLTAEVIQAFDSPVRRPPRHRPLRLLLLRHRAPADPAANARPANQGEACGVPLDLPALLGRVYYRYPSYLIDAVTEHESGNRLVAVKNVTVGEEFFQGHFPGSPLMPAVLTIEALTQVAAVLVLDRADGTAHGPCVASRCRQRQVPPQRRPRRSPSARGRRCGGPGRRLARVQAAAYVDDQVVAEAELLLAIDAGAAAVDPTAHVDPAAHIGRGHHHRSARHDRPRCPHREALPDWRLGRHRRTHAHRRRNTDFPDGVDRAGAAGSQVQRRGDGASNRPAEHLPRVRHDQPRHRRRRR